MKTISYAALRFARLGRILPAVSAMFLGFSGGVEAQTPSPVPSVRHDKETVADIAGLPLSERDAVVRALGYFREEIPRWKAENACFSCHHHGDATRAVLAARERGFAIAMPSAVLQPAREWLTHPERWLHNGGGGPESDMVLARLQFAAALAAMVLSPEEKAPSSAKAALLQAAAAVAQDPQADGAWHTDAEGTLGSPVTYGTTLATATGRAVLHQADPELYRAVIARADAWLHRAPVVTVLDAAAVLWSWGDRDWSRADAVKTAQLKTALATIRLGEYPKGGWGPRVQSYPEAFDTALVLLALRPYLHEPEFAAASVRARTFLVKIQRPEGYWPETTRPPQGESLPQRLSTTSWVVQALVAGDRLPKPKPAK